MHFVELHPKKECRVKQLEGYVESYFHDEAQIVSCHVNGETYGFVCFHEGLQVKENEVKALYGPAIVCDKELKGLSEEEAKRVQTFFNQNKFELNNIIL